MKSLVEQIISGNPQSVVKFYKLYSPRILHYLLKRLPAEEDAEDILNDVFLDAIDSLSI